ncbi:protein containing Signal transduction response regulator, receiver region, partial [Candidatus Magnetomorum sp. HK-1]
DVHMPQMNGLEATKKIRKSELSENKERIPIIALTASLMKEERDRCKQAGMDFVVGKPIDFDQLFAAMEKTVHPWRGQSFKKIKKTPDFNYEKMMPSLKGIDTKKGLKTWTNKESYTRALIRFSSEFKNAPDKIARHIDTGDIEKAHSLAHSLKGISGNLSVVDVYNAALETDSAIQKKQDDEVKRHLKSLRSAMDIAVKSIQTLDTIKESKEKPKKDIDVNYLNKVFKEMSESFEEYNPDSVSPFLEELEKYLQPEQLDPIKKQLNLYDFMEAKAETLKLAQTLGLA